ncbi:MAG: hypothetical protein B7Y51_09230 [Burkholderiales bacterium 28-67-8]|nr:MAG: hypothetical protein B7Y51_09230 [Burkholderiales bacterium 28-67-8]
MLIAERAERATQWARQLTRRPSNFVFVPSHENQGLNYFQPEFEQELAQLKVGSFSCRSADDTRPVDLLICTAHGSDLAPQLWSAHHQLGPQCMVATWFWDNHLAHMANLRTALASDFVFASHAYAAGGLLNPVAPYGSHVAACSAQWTREQAMAGFEAAAHQPRSNRLLVNYVAYPSAGRTPLLQALNAANAPELDVLLMQPDDRTRYFSLSPSERFAEWAQHKAALILPIDRDLSTRLFDALLCGQVPVLVRGSVVDLDQVITPADQHALGFVQIDSADVQSIRDGAVLAARRWDEQGLAGARRRHEYVLGAHMLISRIELILKCLWALGTGEATVAHVPGAGALALQPAAATGR